VSLVVSVPTVEDVRRLGEQVDGIEWMVWDLTGEAPAERLDVVVPPLMAAAALLERLTGVEVGLVQMQSLGFDGVAENVSPRTTIANAAGAHEDATAELGLALILSENRLLPTFRAQQRERQWTKAVAPGLFGKSVLIVGAGGVARALALRLRPFGVRLQRVGRTAREDDLGQVHALDRLDELWSEADVVVLAVPGNAQTRHLVDRARLSHLRDGALLVNLARGPVVDTDALAEALREGRIRAAIDVVDPEPLPPQHPLWHLENVAITPHVGGQIDAMRSLIDAVLVPQLRRLVAGEPPAHVVRMGDPTGSELVVGA
jgi:phosphoglycerate dehydrogenase-like enzyme